MDRNFCVCDVVVQTASRDHCRRDLVLDGMMKDMLSIEEKCWVFEVR